MDESVAIDSIEVLLEALCLFVEVENLIVSGLLLNDLDLSESLLDSRQLVLQ